MTNSYVKFVSFTGHTLSIHLTPEGKAILGTNAQIFAQMKGHNLFIKVDADIKGNKVNKTSEDGFSVTRMMSKLQKQTGLPFFRGIEPESVDVNKKSITIKMPVISETAEMSHIADNEIVNINAVRNSIMVLNTAIAENHIEIAVNDEGRIIGKLMLT